MDRPRYIDYGWIVLSTLLIFLSVAQIAAGGLQTGFVLVVLASLAMIVRSVTNLRGGQ